MLYGVVICQFESSSKWPDDVLAITRIKTAFYLKIGSSLRTKFETPTTVGWVDFCPCVCVPVGCGLMI